MSSHADIFAVEPPRVVSGIPSFVPEAHYATNFSVQWTRFRDTQLDSVTGLEISKRLLEALLGYSVEALAGRSVLEVGAGAGRFTEHFVRHAALVVAIDLSEAIFANTALGSENLVAAQADLLDMPPLRRKFDVVYCRGVIQHTPSPERAIEKLHEWARPGGEVVFDVYPRGRLGRLRAKYLWRRIVPRLMSWERCATFLEQNALPLLRARWALRPLFPGKAVQLLDYALPLWDYKGDLPLSEEQLVEWCVLDTLDGLYAVHDNPRDPGEILEVLRSLPCEVVSHDPLANRFKTRVRDRV
jgi:SAM-dependent methyltransferase